MDVASDWPHNNNASLDDGDDFPDDAPFPLHLASAVRCIYGVQRLHPRQVEAVSRLVLDEASQGCLILVDRTGAGKLLVLFLTAAAVGGVTLVLVPLLSLTAAQLAKLHAAVQGFGTINAVHFDKHS